MKYTKSQKKQIAGFESYEKYKKFIAEKYNLGRQEFKIIDNYIVIKSNL